MSLSHGNEHFDIDLRTRDPVAAAQGVDVSTATPETGLAEAGLDCLAVAELLFSVEEEFGVNVGDVPMDQVPATIAQLVALIDRSEPVVKK